MLTLQKYFCLDYFLFLIYKFVILLKAWFVYNSSSNIEMVLIYCLCFDMCHFLFLLLFISLIINCFFNFLLFFLWFANNLFYWLYPKVLNFRHLMCILLFKLLLPFDFRSKFKTVNLRSFLSIVFPLLT